jgi:hypothetical protein
MDPQFAAALARHFGVGELRRGCLSLAGLSNKNFAATLGTVEPLSNEALSLRVATPLFSHSREQFYLRAAANPGSVSTALSVFSCAATGSTRPSRELEMSFSETMPTS